MSPDEFAAFRDVYLDRIIQPMEANLRVLSLINRDADLYHWWRDFIDGPMGLVPIGSEEFRQSRAGLIHHTYLNGVREMASLSPVDFKALSMAEVFDVIGGIRMQQRNEENLRKQAISTNSKAKQTAKGTVDQTVDPAKTDGSERNSNSEKKSWSKLATELKNKWFAAMTQKKQWIPRKQFLNGFLNGKEGKRDKWKGVSVATEDKRFPQVFI